MTTTGRKSRNSQASLFLGLASTMLGIYAVASRFYPILVLLALTAAGAIVLGFLSKRAVRRSGGLLVGSGRATGGICLSLAGILLGFFLPFT
jgi:hypothetical protein